MQAKSNSQNEISEFIADAVSSAIVRRGLGFEAEASLTTLSEDEVGAIRGGQRVPVVVTAGLIEVPKEVI
jgi:hypothetical protein